MRKWTGCEGSFELAPHAGKEHPQVLGLLDVLGPPDLLEELAVRHEAAGIAHEQGDDVPLLGGEVDGLAVARPAWRPGR